MLAGALVGAAALVVPGLRTGPATERAAAAPATKRPPTPFESARAALAAQATALVKRDEKGWLAAVDPSQPKLRARYRTLYRSLHGLRVSHFEYHPFNTDASKVTAKSVAVGVRISYCFSLDVCPAKSRAGEGRPEITQALTLKPIGGKFLITALGKAESPNRFQPTPWEGTELVFAQGKRVTVAAPKSQAKHLKRVLPLAEQAAAASDRFAGYVGNPQKRYRVYLADKKTWKSWYGGVDGNWSIGYAIPLNDAQSDVVLKTSELISDREFLLDTLRHEMGHVVTVGDAAQRDADDWWLDEGIAEYIGSAPKSVTSSWRRSSVRAKVRGSARPKSIVIKQPGPKASFRQIDAAYGLGHFAVGCMADKYGERKLFDFVRLRLREGKTYDQASRDAFGKPFKTVDKACVTWIRKHA